tara:strand:- start:257 stop:1159 length:903 start_codon:yes stop_codon:yes gene_type:complete
MPRPPVSRVSSTDKHEKNYLVKRDDGSLYFSALPNVQLSFRDLVSSDNFSTSSMLGDSFSAAFHAIFADNMPNLTTVFVRQGIGWTGPRQVPIKFTTGPPCTEAVVFLEVSPKEFLTTFHLRMYNENTAYVRQAETYAINRSLVRLPRSSRDVTLFHWVTKSPQLWHSLKARQSVYTAQWLDTHSHPAWFWPKAATRKGMRTFLSIHCPAGTPMFRIDRHSSVAYRSRALLPGQYTQHDADPHETEVRLPPGKYVVQSKPSVERYAGEPTLLVRLLYAPQTYQECSSQSYPKRVLSRRRQ